MYLIIYELSFFNVLEMKNGFDIVKLMTYLGLKHHSTGFKIKSTTCELKVKMLDMMVEGYSIKVFNEQKLYIKTLTVS